MQPPAVGGAPQWLRGLLSEEFFDACAAHPAERKNDKNHFCADCVAALRSAATASRTTIPTTFSRQKIWKYASCSCFVVRVDDLKLFDCTGIQSHTVSDHEVVFLNERTARKRSAIADNPCCAACARPLLPRHDYCSLFCKVKHLGESDRGLRCALRVSRRKAAAPAGIEADGAAPDPQSGKRARPAPALAEAGRRCGSGAGSSPCRLDRHSEQGRIARGPGLSVPRFVVGPLLFYL